MDIYPFYLELKKSLTVNGFMIAVRVFGFWFIGCVNSQSL